MAQNDINAGKVIISGDTTGAVAAIKEAQSALAKLTVLAKDSEAGIAAMSQKSSDGLSSMSKAFDQLKGIAASYVGLNIVKEIFDQTRSWNSLNNALANVFHSQSAATDQLDYVRKVSQKLGINVTQAAESYIGIAAAAKGAGRDAKDAQAIFDAFAGTMANAGKGTQEVAGVMTQLSQAMGKNALEWADLKIIDSWFPGVNAKIAEALGLTSEQFMDLVHSGGLTVDMLVKASLEMRKAVVEATSLNSSIGRLSTAWDTLLRDLGNTDAFKAAIDGLQDIVKWLDKVAVGVSEGGFQLLMSQSPQFAAAQAAKQQAISQGLAEKATALPPEFTTGGAIIGPDTSIDDRKKKAFEFFKSNGFSAAQAAGIVGSLMQESGINPSKVNPRSGATGIAQWLGSRQIALQALPNADTLETQLGFILQELKTTEKAALAEILAAATPEQAAIAFTGTTESKKGFERPGAAEANFPKRFANANAVFSQFGGISDFEAVNKAAQDSADKQKKIASDLEHAKFEAHQEGLKAFEDALKEEEDATEKSAKTKLEIEKAMSDSAVDMAKNKAEQVAAILKKQDSELAAKIGGLELKVSGFGPDQLKQISQLTGDKKALYEARLSRLKSGATPGLSAEGQANELLRFQAEASQGLIAFEGQAQETLANVSAYAASAMLNVQHSIANALLDGINNWKHFGDSVLNILKNFVANIAASGISEALGMLTGISAGGKLTGGGIVGLVGSFFHSGGEVGKTQNIRGFTGLGHDEVLAVLQRGEIVLTRGQAAVAASMGALPKFHDGGMVGGGNMPSYMYNTSANNSQVTINIQDGVVASRVRGDTSRAADLGKQVDAAVKQVLAREQRPGGILAGRR